MSTDLEPTNVPTALGAERALLGVMIQSRPAVEHARRCVAITDLWRGAHELIFAVCCDLTDAGTTVDPIAVLGELERRGQLAKAGGANYLHGLYAIPGTLANVGDYGQQIRSAARRRQLIATGTRLQQIAHDVTDLDDVLQAAAREAITLDLLVDEPDGERPVAGLITWDAFLDEPDRAEDWIVPGLLERQDVVMILAKPGGGKSWLSRQIALTVSAGVHPFRPEQRIAPVRTLLVDLENPPSMVRRQTRPLRSTLQRIGDWQPDRAHLWAQPAGLDIRKRADAQQLERVIADTRPSLVALGSLYNAFERGRDDWDTAAEEAKAVFNRLRGRYGCAFWIEHHMPKGGEHKNPFGSSVWERWPGFGRVIDRRGENLWELAKTFRGDRDVREFPAGLHRGGALPWTAVWDPDEVELLASAGEGRMR